VAGNQAAEQSLADDGRLAAALDAEGLPSDAVTGSEVRWGDDTRLIALRFESIDLNDASRVALSLLGIGDVESGIGLVGNQTVIELTGPDIDGVAYVLSILGQGSEQLMYTIVAPSVAEAEPIVRAISDASPSSD